MKKTRELLCLTLPIAALVVLGFVRVRVDTQLAQRKSLPFKLVLNEVTVEPKARENSDVDVTTVIDHNGPVPKWWGKAGNLSYLPNLVIGDTYLQDETRKRYREIQFADHRQGIYAMSQTFDESRQQYVYVYRINTSFIPDSVHKLTFHSTLLHPTGNTQVSATVRSYK